MRRCWSRSRRSRSSAPSAFHRSCFHHCSRSGRLPQRVSLICSRQRQGRGSTLSGCIYATGMPARPRSPNSGDSPSRQTRRSRPALSCTFAPPSAGPSSERFCGWRKDGAAAGAGVSDYVTLRSEAELWVLKAPKKSSQASGFLASEFLSCISPGFMISCSKFDRPQTLAVRSSPDPERAAEPLPL